MCESIASALRIGEERREATSKIRGFLYQDLVAIREILLVDKTYKCYVEWVEDIFLENEHEVKIIQVKYYPSSSVNFYEILSDMHYQIIKDKVFSEQNKSIETYCYHHSNTTYNSVEVMEKLKGVCSEFEIDDSNRANIVEKFNNCSKHSDRKKLLFENVGYKNFVGRYKFDVINLKDIEGLRIEVSSLIISELSNSGLQDQYPEDFIEKIISSMAIHFIQMKYYTDECDIQKRAISKESLLDFIKGILDEESSNSNLVKMVVIESIDSVFEEILIDIDDVSRETIVAKYEKIYVETKKYFNYILEDKENRFKFINTINNNDNSSKLNRQIYLGYNLHKEKDIFLKNDEGIRVYIRYLWKLIFNTYEDLNDFNISKFIIKSKDYFLLKYECDKDGILLLSELGNSTQTKKLSNILDRIKDSNIRPTKWFLSGTVKGVFDYSYNIDQIANKVKGKEDSYNIDDIDTDSEGTFNIKCMKCICVDTKEMGKKDDLEKGFILNYCKEG